MSKSELLKALATYPDDAQIVVSFDTRTIAKITHGMDYVTFGIDCVEDGWKPSNVADISIGNDLIMG
ncbi:MAG: hypothetical protein COA94_04680 [Rickettsiales bacterium]|nr:MAG: hypothetical protein COA94_04680 [Rickettsiales bacterium]